MIYRTSDKRIFRVVPNAAYTNLLLEITDPSDDQHARIRVFKPDAEKLIDMLRCGLEALKIELPVHTPGKDEP